MKKTIQSVISIILAICVFTSFTAFASTADRPWSESETIKTIDHVVYELNGDHWEVKDFFDTNEAYNDKTITQIAILDLIDEKPVTTVNYYNNFDGVGYTGSEYVTSVTIPDTVAKIGEEAFACFTALDSISLPSSVTSVGEGAFKYCGAKTVTFKQGEEKTDAFVIPRFAFAFSKLQKIQMPNAANIKINAKAFYKTDIKTVSTKNITYIGNKSFANCKKLEKITVPKTIKKIGKDAFKGSKNLKKLYINTKNTKVINKTNTFKTLNKKCKVYVKTKAMKKAVKKAGFKGKIIIKK